MKEIFDTLEFVQSHGGMMFLFVWVLFDIRFLRRDVDELRAGRRKV